MTLPSRGRPGLTISMTIERELTMDDLIQLELDGGEKVAQPVLQRLKASHHTAARLLAEGRKAIEVAQIVNRTPQNIRDLARNDPSFQELVVYYRSQLEEIGLEDSIRIQAKLRLIGEMGTDELMERLEDDGKRAAMSTDTVRQVAAMALDRTVAPPKTAQPVINTPTHITFNMGPRDLKPQTPEINDKIVEHENEPKSDD